MSANTRRIRLYRAALKAAQTLARSCTSLVSMPVSTENDMRLDGIALQDFIDRTHRYEREANEHLERKVASRRRRAA